MGSATWGFRWAVLPEALRNMRYLKTVLAAVSLLTTAVPGFAADMDEPILIEATDEYKPVEVGSGWYLRGDIGYTINKPYDKFEEMNGFKVSDTPLSYGAGVGYHINDFLRAEFNVSMLPTQKFSTEFDSSCEGTQTTTVVVRNPNGEDEVFVNSERASRDCVGSNAGVNKAYDGMASLYADLGTFSGFTPYVGAGVGVIYSKYRSSQGDRNCVEPDPTIVQGGNTTTTIVYECDNEANYVGAADSESQYGLVYSLAAGVAWNVADNVALDFGYQYRGAPGLRYVTSENDIVKVSEGTDYHTVKVGLRYDLW